MASSRSRDMETNCVVQLSALFKDLDRGLIQMVAEDCSFDVERSAKLLYKMIKENNQVLSTNCYPNGTRPKPTAPLPKDPYDQVIGFIRDGYKILILMRGLPGSGKSSLAVSLLHHCLGNVNRDEFIYSTDQYFYRTGVYKFDSKELELAHAWNQRRCFSNLKRGVSPVIIDNTNLTTWEMKIYCVMAVKFGYIIEILEGATPWALNPNTLATKNSHGVTKQKIQEMRERYQQNVTVKDLLCKFQLAYEVSMPQYRRYPPIPRPIVNVDVVDEPRRKEPQLPIEYVHKFEMKSEIPKVEEVRMSDTTDLVRFDNESKVKQQTPEDLISFNQEHKSPNKKEESMNAHLVKQLEQNNKLMYKMTEIVSMHIKQRNNSPTVADVDMEVDTPSNNGNGCDDPMQLSSSSRKLSYLEEENLKLQAELDRTKSEAEMTRSINPFATLTSKQTQGGDAQKDTLQAPRLEMYFKNTNTEKGSIEDFEIVGLESSPSPISNTKTPLAEGEKSPVPKFNSRTLGFTEAKWEPNPQPPRKSPATGALSKGRISTSPSSTSQIKSVNITNITNTTAKVEKSAIPKFDSKAWGLPEDVLRPWDATPPQEISRPHMNDALLMTCEQGTNTTDEDFKNVRQGTVGKVNFLAGPGGPINRGNFSIKRRSRKNASLDKGCMTDEEELLLGLKLDEKEQVKKLMELFPGIPVEDMLYVYEKCDKDFHWAVDLISSSPMVFPSITKSGSEQKNKEPDTSEKAAPKSPSFNFELNDWNLVPTNSDKIPKTSEDAAAFKKNQEEAAQQKKQEEAEQQKKQEEVQELKKQLEKTVTFGKEHYSEHIWQLKNAKMGVPSTSTSVSASASAPPQPEEELDELMTVDDDMIYISDDSSEGEFNEEGDGSTDDDLVELNLGDELVQQLESMFGQLSLENFKPIVQIPESLARQLHAFYLESICRQIENQSEYITSQLKEDEEFAMKLQEAERKSASGNKMEEIMDEQLAMNLYKKEVDQRKDMSPDTLALKLSKQKLHASFPTIEQRVLDEIMAAHGNNYMETIEAIISSSNLEPVDATNALEPPISDLTLQEMKAQAHGVDEETEEEVDGKVRSAQSYREDANRHMQKHQELQELARRYWGSRNYAVTMFYSELAQKELKKADLANQHAAQCFIRENSSKLRSNDTLDLHFQYAEGALTSLDVFLDYQISNLRTTNKPSGTYFVITGWGKHNPNRKSVLKPLVMRRLNQRQITFSFVNPGMLRIKVLKNLPMSSDIRKKSPK